MTRNAAMTTTTPKTAIAVAREDVAAVAREDVAAVAVMKVPTS